MSKNISELSGRRGLKENLFEEIGLLAKETGTPSVEEMEALADKFLIGKANVYGSASFYDFTREENRGKKVYVCNGSACLCAGTQDKVKETLKGKFKEEEIGEMCCLGRCHENSAFFYEGRNYSGDDIEHLDDALRQAQGVTKDASDDYHVECLGTQILTSNDNVSLSLSKTYYGEFIPLSAMPTFSFAKLRINFKLNVTKLT